MIYCLQRENSWLELNQGGTIRGSINLPAQSLVPTLPALYTLFASAGVKHVVWYCGMYLTVL